MIIFSILFFLIAFLCEGQKSELLRQGSYYNDIDKKVTSIYPNTTIDIPSPLKDGDHVSLSIVADSVGGGIYTIYLYAYVPKSLHKNTTVKITFEDGTTDIYNKIEDDAYSVNLNEEYYGLEFEINGRSIKPLKAKKCKTIEFVGIAKYNVKEEKSFFQDFLNSYNK